jgi:SAM-dependent methyltransferase
LNLPQSAQILDVPCGTGRHSESFGRHGFQVVGVDISPACISIAKRNASTPKVNYVLGDMKDLSPYLGQFDCVLNLFSSFGYFSTDSENEYALGQMVSALKKGGRLVINVINRDFLLSIYRPSFWFKSHGVLTVNAGSYDPETHYNESYMTIKDESSGETSLSYHRMRLYSSDEIVGLMRGFGLVDIEIYGDSEGAPYERLKSTHPFYIGIKA